MRRDSASYPQRPKVSAARSTHFSPPPCARVALVFQVRDRFSCMPRTRLWCGAVAPRQWVGYDHIGIDGVQPRETGDVNVKVGVGWVVNSECWRIDFSPGHCASGKCVDRPAITKRVVPEDSPPPCTALDFMVVSKRLPALSLGIELPEVAFVPL